MAYIYYIYRSYNHRGHGGYIGQDTHSIFDYYHSRLLQHGRIAYGTISGKIYGSEELIQKHSLSGLYYKYYDNEQDCFGVSNDAYVSFCRLWTHSKPNSIEAKLDFAEMCHILINHHTSDLSAYNIGIGGQNTWTFNNQFLLPLAQQVDSLKRKKSSFSYVSFLQQNNNLQQLQIHFPDGIKDEVKLFAPQAYVVARLIAHAITQQCLSDSQDWADFLQKNIIDCYSTIDVSQESWNAAQFANKIKNYLNKKVHSEVLDWQRVIGKQFSCKIKMDFQKDAARIGKFLARRVKQLAIYSMQNWLPYLRFSGKRGVPNQALTASDKKILRITRSAYIESVQWNKPTTAQTPYNKWFHIAKNYLPSAMAKDIESDIVLKGYLAKVSYEAFCKWVEKAIGNGRNSSLLRGQTTYELEAYGPSGESFYRGGINSDYINEGEYSLDHATQTLRWKTREVVEKQRLHGDILHWWDAYYRLMVTLWLKERRGSQLNPIGNNMYMSPNTNWAYRFVNSTWQEISANQRATFTKAWVY